MEPFQYGTTMCVSTVSGLLSPLKITLDPGNYSPGPYLDGYIFKKQDYDPNASECIHVLNDRDGDVGLVGTYWSGETDNKFQVKMVNDHFLPYLHGNEFTMQNLKFERVYEGDDDDEDWYDDDIECECDEYNTWCDKCTKQVTGLQEYNNIPVLFYLNTSEYKLENMTLDNKCSKHELVAWDVIEGAKGKIGVAILQKKFFDMMGDQMGLAVFSRNGTSGVAFANCNIQKLEQEYGKTVVKVDRPLRTDEDDDEYLDYLVFYPNNKSTLQYVGNWLRCMEKE